MLAQSKRNVENEGVYGSMGHIRYIRELFAAIADQESTADPLDIERLRRSYQTWQQALKGNVTPFIQAEEQLRSDFENTKQPVAKDYLGRILATQYALWLTSLKQQDDAEAQADAVLAKCIAAIQAYESLPGADSLFHHQQPEFLPLTSDERFRAEFLPK